MLESTPRRSGGAARGKLRNRPSNCAGEATRAWGRCSVSQCARAASPAGVMSTAIAEGSPSTRTPEGPKALRSRSATPSGRSAPGKNTARPWPARTSCPMPTWKKSRVRARSRSVKARRLGAPVVPEVCRLTMRCTSPCDTQQKSRQSRRWAAVVNGRRARSSGSRIPRSQPARCRA